MGWSTTVIAPPDGDMRAYFASLRLLLGRDDAVLWPTHGGPVTDPLRSWRPTSRTGWNGRRRWSPASAGGTGTVPAIVAELYTAVPKELHPAAERSVFAHLVKLVDDGVVSCDGPLTAEATFAPV